MFTLKYFEFYIILALISSGPVIYAQTVQSNFPDSLTGTAHKGFNSVSKWHRFFFGENYRKEWSASTKLPVIHLSSFRGGLVAIRQGGGNQTHSLRLKDHDGMEWVLRSVEKYPDAILPDVLKETFVSDIVTDAMSAQHPYSALIVPPIANAVGVPHAHPIIGIVAPDSVLGSYAKTFESQICLLEEREPTGKSVNYIDMLNALDSSNDNSFDSTVFLKARILDVFIGDWDRHGDQWRFKPEKNGPGIKYIPVPRDRDQVFYTNQGVFPYLESRPYVQPFFEGFNPKIRNVGTFLFTSTLLNARLINQFSYDNWMRITNEFVAEVTDSVLDLAISQLPRSVYDIRHDDLLNILKSRRADLPRAFSAYYYFLNKNVFIQTSNKNEFIQTKDTLNNDMQVSIYKLSRKDKIKQVIFSKTYDPRFTKEIRFFIGNGNDSIVIDNKNSSIKLRFSGKDGPKRFNLIGSNKKVPVFEKENSAIFSGDTSRFIKHISSDSANTAVVPGNLFNVITPLLNFAYNLDDGVLLGVQLTFTRGLDYTTSVFSTKRHTSFQQIGFVHSFETRAFEAKYNAEWANAIGNADFLIHATVNAPNNTQNYFGTGNTTTFNKSGDYKQFYRSRYNLYKLSPALRWGRRDIGSFSVGPSIEFYTYDSAENAGRYIETNGAVQSYDSATLSKSKLHGGIILEYKKEKRDNNLLPTNGSFINLRLQGYAGLNTFSKSFTQLFADFGFYKSVDDNETFVVADRVGGGATLGNAAFYQSMFIGGQGNLLGYRRNRYGGQYMAYNNLEARWRLASFRNYILPGQFGLIGLYDIGRVWQKEDRSHQWHNGVGGGIYFAPAQMTLFQIVMSYSPEGWYPTFSLGFRF
jgi:Omp85 superfamily domain